MSTVNANSFKDASGGSNAVLYGVAAPANSMGFRNRIINGDMRIDQRNAGASVTPNNSFTLDRWKGTTSTTSKFTVQRSTVVPSGFTNSLLVTSSSAYSVTASDYFAMGQPIEGFNTADLGWGAAGAQSVVLTFKVRSSLTGTFGGSLRNADRTRSYPFTFTVSAANTFEDKTIVIPGDTSGTWLTDNSTGIEILFGLGVGSSFSGTAGAWAGANYISATGAVSVVGTSGATFYITGVQLEAGSVASPFERIDYGRQLIQCQRYFETGQIVTFSGATNVGYFSSVPFTFQVAKRAAPTVTFASTSFAGNVSALSAVDITTIGAVGQFSVTTGAGSGKGTATAAIEL